MAPAPTKPVGLDEITTDWK